MRLHPAANKCGKNRITLAFETMKRKSHAKVFKSIGDGLPTIAQDARARRGRYQPAWAARRACSGAQSTRSG